MVSFLADLPRKTVEMHRPTSVIFVYFCYHFESVKVLLFGSFLDSSIAAVDDLSRHILEFCVFVETAWLPRHYPT